MVSGESRHPVALDWAPWWRPGSWLSHPVGIVIAGERVEPGEASEAENNITVRQAADGPRYDARARVGGDRVEARTFRRRGDADAWLRQVKVDDLAGVRIDPAKGRTLFADFARSWVDRGGSRSRLTPRTVELYDTLYERHLKPTFGSRKLSAINPELVRAWHAQVAKDVSELQAAKAYRLLRAILNTAMADGYLPRNPCQVVGAGQERSPERPFIAADVVWALADAIDPRGRALVLVAGFGALRLGELLGLRVGDVDLESGALRVEQQGQDLKGKGRVVYGPKSAAGVRSVHLPAQVVAAIAEHIATHLTALDPGAPLFVGERGGRLPRQTLYKWWSDARAKVKGTDEVTIHDLRHAAGTLAAWTGATQKELMTRLGHSSPRAAIRYQHAAQNRDRELAERLDALIARARAIPGTTSSEPTA